jgi:hypothetical protein
MCYIKYATCFNYLCNKDNFLTFLTFLFSFVIGFYITALNNQLKRKLYLYIKKDLICCSVYCIFKYL